MGHPGKHIIDPETGLCEICDRDAIQEVKQGKRPGKQVFYSNHNNKLTDRSTDQIFDEKDQYVYETDDEPRARYVRKPIYPAPTQRPRRIIYEKPIEEPVIVRRKIVRRDRPVPEDVIIRRRPPPPPRTKTSYYVDKEDQTLPERYTPLLEPPQRYVVQSKRLPPAQVVRVIRRQPRTAIPPPREPWHTGTKRQVKSDTEVIQREQRKRHDETYYRPLSSIKPEMYYIEAISNPIPRSPPASPVHMSHENSTSPSKAMYQGDRNRKQNRVEPLERRNQDQPSPTVVRRVYKKLPPGKYEPPNDEFPPNENHPRYGRKNGKNLSPLKPYGSSSQVEDRNNQSPDPAKNPAIYYIRSVDDFQ